ncbi:MAG: SCO family protein [Abditibacteriaceae bacterium]
MKLILYGKSNHLWHADIGLKVLLSVVLLALFARETLADGGSDLAGAGGSYYGEQLRPKYNDQPSSAALNKVGWTQNLDQQIPLDLDFRDDKGQQVELKKYFGQKPVVMLMVYYTCPYLCGEVLHGVFSGLKGINFQASRDYQVVVVSINPDEDSELAASKKAEYLKQFGMEAQADGFHFLTGKTPAIQKLAKAIGFDYVYDKSLGQFAHPAGLVLVTPHGRVARYMSGVLFEPQDLRLGLLDAGRGKIGSALDMIVLKCYHYDGEAGKYTVAVMNILRVGGLITVILVGLLMVGLVRRDVTRTKAQEEDELEDENKKVF